MTLTSLDILLSALIACVVIVGVAVAFGGPGAARAWRDDAGGLRDDELAGEPRSRTGRAFAKGSAILLGLGVLGMAGLSLIAAIEGA